MSLFTHWIICKGPFSGQPYAGPLCAKAGVVPGKIYNRSDYAADDALDDCNKLDALSAANFYVYCWYDEEGIKPRGERLRHGRNKPKCHQVGFSLQGCHQLRRGYELPNARLYQRAHRLKIRLDADQCQPKIDKRIKKCRGDGGPRYWGPRCQGSRMGGWLWVGDSLKHEVRWVRTGPPGRLTCQCEEHVQRRQASEILSKPAQRVVFMHRTRPARVQPR